MHNNYYFLKALVPHLEAQLTGLIIRTCFTQDKDELVLGFSNDREFWIKAVLKNEFSCLYFPKHFSRARRNSTNIFPEVLNSQITGIRQFTFERCLQIMFENGFSLLFKLHGNRSNILLYKEEQVIGLFKNGLKQDWNIALDNLDRAFDLGQEAFKIAEGQIQKLNPTYGKIPIQWLSENGYEQTNMEGKWNLFSEMNALLKNPNFFLCENQGLVFSLLPIGKNPKKLSKDPMESLNIFYIAFSKDKNLKDKKVRFKKTLEQRSKNLKSYINKASTNLEKLETEVPPNHIADIIMANLHTIPGGASKIELANFYSGGTIEIKLKKDLSAQKNAENYYRKSKNRAKELAIIKSNIEKRKSELSNVRNLLELLVSINSEKEMDELIQAKVNERSTVKKTEETLPYKEYEFENFKIWVGKNAKANDKLTLKYSHKNDLWLHAKDVSGSHVLIKQIPGKAFSVLIKEKAAELAAWYSKRKNESVVPVVCTSKKYVRKPKGLPPGSVVVDREEEVFLVKPENHEQNLTV